MGEKFSWGEAIALARTAKSDTRTYLGAAVNGLTYPTSRADILTVVKTLALAKNDSDLDSYFLPFPTGPEEASADEISAAEAELEASIVFH